MTELGRRVTEAEFLAADKDGTLDKAEHKSMVAARVHLPIGTKTIRCMRRSCELKQVVI